MFHVSLFVSILVPSVFPISRFIMRFGRFQVEDVRDIFRCVFGILQEVPRCFWPIGLPIYHTNSLTHLFSSPRGVLSGPSFGVYMSYRGFTNSLFLVFVSRVAPSPSFTQRSSSRPTRPFLRAALPSVLPTSSHPYSRPTSPTSILGPCPR